MPCAFGAASAAPRQPLLLLTPRVDLPSEQGGREPWNHDEKVLGIYREWMGKEEQVSLHILHRSLFSLVSRLPLLSLLSLHSPSPTHLSSSLVLHLSPSHPQLKAILSDEPGKPYTVSSEEEGKGWKQLWAAEAEALVCNGGPNSGPLRTSAAAAALLLRSRLRSLV